MKPWLQLLAVSFPSTRWNSWISLQPRLQNLVVAVFDFSSIFPSTPLQREGFFSFHIKLRTKYCIKKKFETNFLTYKYKLLLLCVHIC